MRAMLHGGNNCEGYMLRVMMKVHGDSNSGMCMNIHIYHYLQLPLDVPY